ncbi:hypothetical protein I7I53_04854 [Histoplasma capsulatum var. duboisii H88]|uniref:Uncharacterized protein n=1 Tax=Ajellomyces capsulatus (strain H88) TaxID=544711 RepID=A0A8A1LRC8_AJEC8|nr:hypothetical protein I7I53_04854 [Histoplasma capsulatum var. duboisii H88]
MGGPPHMLHAKPASGNLISPFLHGRIRVEPQGKEARIAAICTHHRAKGNLSNVRRISWQR